jgi:aerobic carbon-monoxide dehydrogenase medium subunit
MACVLAVPGAPACAVLAALDAAPLVLGDATGLLTDPVGEAARIVAALDLADPWRAALARVALREAATAAGEAA